MSAGTGSGMRSEPHLERIAGHIADGLPVDWESETSPDPRADNLRLLERIRDVHQAAVLPRTWGPLELVERIGGGAYGDVYRARDPSLQTDVALKLLHADRAPDAPDALLREARHLAKIRHANVVTIHGAAVHEGRVGIWTELVRGRTLEQLLREQGPFRAEEAALVALDVVRALAAVHGAGFVHRDVKTSNVMREAGGRVVLTDFGSVIRTERLEEAPAEEALVGTAPYLAPEAFRGECIGKCADLYALGVVMYRLVTGRYPVEARTPDELREKHERRAARPLLEARPDLPAEFVRVVERATSPDRAARYANVGELGRDLAAFLGARGKRRASDRRRPRVAAALAAVAILAVAAWLGFDRGRDVLLPLDVDCALYRAAAGSKEHLTPGARVRPGDRLFLELRSSRTAWVYVMNEDERGNAYILFPLTGIDLANPLPAGSRQIPGSRDGRPITWNVDTAGGRETLYVVASTRALETFEERLAALPEAGAAAAVAAELVHRGIGDVGPMPGAPEEPPPLSELVARLAEDGGRGIRTWSIALENPVP